MRRNTRLDAVNRLREEQRNFPSNRMFDERFDRNFDRMENPVERGMKRPVLSMIAVWTIALIGNLIFWGLLIALVLFLLGHFGVI